MRLFRNVVLSAVILLALGVGTSTVAATALARPSAPVVHEFTKVLAVKPMQPSTATTACATHTWVFYGAVQKSFNSGQIDEYADVGFEVDSADTSIFCGYVISHGWIRCNFGCTGTWGYFDLYWCDSLNGPCTTKVDHVQWNFVTFVGSDGVTPVGATTCYKFQTNVGVPAPGGGYWYTTSQIRSFNMFC